MNDLPLSVGGRKALDIALEAARNAGALVRARFYTDKEVSYKGPSNPVTDVDIATEALLRESFALEFPNIGFLGEESGGDSSDVGLRWVVDPVDGTRNYALGVPHFAVSLALVNGIDVLLGVTYDPIRDEMFYAAKGYGAYLNGIPISVTKQTLLSESILGLDLGPVDVNALSAFKLLQRLWPDFQAVRILGSAALGLAYIASGRFDIYFHYTVAPWDVAAGILLVREAGGQVKDEDGVLATLESTGVVSSSPVLLEEFLGQTEEL